MHNPKFTSRFLLAAITGVFAVAGNVPALASEPTGNPAVDCPALANSLLREPAWYAADCRGYYPSRPSQVVKHAESPLVNGDPAFQLDLRANPNVFNEFALPNANAPSNAPTTTLDSFALEHDNATGVLWAIENVTLALGQVNKATGAFTAGPTVTGITGNVTGLAFVDSNSTFYVSAGDGTASTIYSLDKTTGVATAIGATGTALMIDIAINNAGQMYGHDIGTDSIYSINTSTGAATLIGPTGVLANFAQSIDFDKSTGVLYAWIYEGAGVNRFATIDLATGTATTVSTPTNQELEGALTPVSLQSFSVD